MGAGALVCQDKHKLLQRALKFCGNIARSRKASLNPPLHLLDLPLLNRDEKRRSEAEVYPCTTKGKLAGYYPYRYVLHPLFLSPPPVKA
jgi:hypothetical protein